MIECERNVVPKNSINNSTQHHRSHLSRYEEESLCRVHVIHSKTDLIYRNATAASVRRRRRQLRRRQVLRWWWGAINELINNTISAVNKITSRLLDAFAPQTIYCVVSDALCARVSDSLVDTSDSEAMEIYLIVLLVVFCCQGMRSNCIERTTWVNRTRTTASQCMQYKMNGIRDEWIRTKMTFVPKIALNWFTHETRIGHVSVLRLSLCGWSSLSHSLTSHAAGLLKSFRKQRTLDDNWAVYECPSNGPNSNWIVRTKSISLSCSHSIYLWWFRWIIIAVSEQSVPLNWQWHRINIKCSAWWASNEDNTVSAAGMNLLCVGATALINIEIQCI